MYFAESTPVFDIYRTIGAAMGIAVEFDEDMANPATAISLLGSTGQGAFDILCYVMGHAYKPIDENTLLVFDNTRANRKRYRETASRPY